jgi:hypothetical protein
VTRSCSSLVSGLGFSSGSGNRRFSSNRGEASCAVWRKRCRSGFEGRSHHMQSSPGAREHVLSPRYGASPKASPRTNGSQEKPKVKSPGSGRKSPQPTSGWGSPQNLQQGRTSPQHSHQGRTSPRRKGSPLKVRVIPIDEWHHQPSHYGGYPGAISPRSSGGITSALTTAHIERQQRIENDRRAREQARRDTRAKVQSSLDLTADPAHRREVRLDVCVDGCCAHMGRKCFGVQYSAERHDPAPIGPSGWRRECAPQKPVPRLSATINGTKGATLPSCFPPSLPR